MGKGNRVGADKEQEERREAVMIREDCLTSSNRGVIMSEGKKMGR